MTEYCDHLGPRRTQLVKVRCNRQDLSETWQPLYDCCCPALLRRGKPAACLPKWPGPWDLPDQASEAALILLCRACPLFAQKNPSGSDHESPPAGEAHAKQG